MSKKKMTGEEKLLLAVLETHIKDYLVGVKMRWKTKKSKGGKEGDSQMLGYARTAREWILDNSKKSNELFGFKFLCRYFGLDPDRMKLRLLEIKEPENVKEVYRRMKNNKPKGGQANGNDILWNKPKASS